jgi:hypothetical protein
MAKGTKTGGRQKGTPNRTTAAIKDAILAAFDQAGGISYLVRQSSENPVAFMGLLGKVLPMQVAGDPDNPVALSLKVSFVRPKE